MAHLSGHNLVYWSDPHIRSVVLSCAFLACLLEYVTLVCQCTAPFVPILLWNMVLSELLFQQQAFQVNAQHSTYFLEQNV